MFFTYILHNSFINKYYIGQTQDIDAKLLELNSRKAKRKFVKKGTVEWKLVYKEEFENKWDAVIREKYLKSLKSKKDIEDLIMSA
ncbi:MAG: GIY-YIG nuclease family protein [Candidatus Dojkabacteria bacterium]